MGIEFTDMPATQAEFSFVRDSTWKWPETRPAKVNPFFQIIFAPDLVSTSRPIHHFFSIRRISLNESQTPLKGRF
jgi:hypothetical protein